MARFPLAAALLALALTASPAHAQLTTVSKVLGDYGAEMLKVTRDVPTLVRGLLGSLSLRLVQLTTRLAELTGGRVEARFARLFLKLAEQLGRPERGGIFIPLPLTRQELADWTGTTIETSIRISAPSGET